MVHVIVDEVFETFRWFDAVYDGGTRVVDPGELNYVSVKFVFVVDEPFVAGVDSADEEAEGEEVAMVHCLPGVADDGASADGHGVDGDEDEPDGRSDFHDGLWFGLFRWGTGPITHQFLVE